MDDMLGFANHFLNESYNGLDKNEEEAKAERLKAYYANESAQKEKMKTMISEDHTSLIERATGILKVDDHSRLRRAQSEAEGIFGQADKYL